MKDNVLESPENLRWVYWDGNRFRWDVFEYCSGVFRRQGRLGLRWSAIFAQMRRRAYNLAR
jgi:hypothetical protein